MSTDDKDDMKEFSQFVHKLLAPGDSEQERENSKSGLYVAKEGNLVKHSDPTGDMREFVKELFRP